MRFLIAFFLFIFGQNLNLSAQSIQDSLTTLLKKAEGRERVNILGELAENLAKSNSVKAITFAEEGIDLSIQLDYESGKIYCLHQKAKSLYGLGKYNSVDSLILPIVEYYKRERPGKEAANSLRLQGSSFERQGRYDESLEFQKEALAIAISIKYSEGESYAMNNIAIIHMRKANYDESIVSYLKAIKLIEKDYPVQKVANTFRNIGIVYKTKGDYEMALEYYFKALKINQHFKDPKKLAENWNSIGTIFSSIKNTSKAKSAYSKAVSYLAPDQYSRLSQNINNNLGTLYSHGINSDSALYYYQKALSISNHRQGYVGTGILMYNIGSVHFGKKEYESAMSYYAKALQAEPHAPDLQNQTRTWIKMGMLHLELLDLPKSITYLKKGLISATELGIKQSKSDALKYLIEAYKKTGELQNALDCQHQYISVNDQLFNAEKAAEIQEMVIIHEEAQNIQKIKNLEQEKLLKKYTNERLWALILTILVIGSLLFLFQRNRIKKAKKQQHLLNIEKNWLELQSLRNQFKPHFVFNALSSIQSYLAIKENEKAEVYISQFAQLMREMLENTNQDNILLDDEISFLKRYLNIEQLRTNNQFEYTIHKDVEVDGSDILFPNLILQTIVENAIWHGIMPKKEKGLIQIRIKRETNWLLIEVVDNGVGRAYHKNKEHNSKGLDLLQKRIDVLNQKENQDIHWNIEDLKNNLGEPTGTKVSIRYLVYSY